MAVRVTQVAAETTLAPSVHRARVSQVAVEVTLVLGLVNGPAGIVTGEAFGAGGTVTVDSITNLIGVAGIGTEEAFGAGIVAGPITGGAGLASEEAFGSGGLVTTPINGTAGIASGEAFGSGGQVDLHVAGAAGIASGETFSSGIVAGPITGTAGIDESAMGSTGAVVAALVSGTAGIASEEAFGADGYIAGPITGAAGIASGEAFGANGSISGPITGAAGILSGEAFGVNGSVTGPILGTAGIASAEAFGSGGDVYQPLIGLAGIASGETFGSGGSITPVLGGYAGIATGEIFGRGGAVLNNSARFALYIRGMDWTDLKVPNTFKYTSEFAGRAQASFTVEQIGSDIWRPTPGDEVEYWCGNKKLFGGFIQAAKEKWAKPYLLTNRCLIECTCVDFRGLLEGRIFSRIYEGPTHRLSTIMGDIRPILEQEGLTYDDVEDYTVTGARLRFEDEQLTRSLDRVCAIFGCDWRIDHYGRVRIERTTADLAPLTLSDGDGNWSEMYATRSDENYRNRQGARTAVPTGGQRSQTLPGNGTWGYTLTWQTTGKPKVVVNDVEQTVILYSDRGTMAWDFAYTVNGSVLYHNPAQTPYTSSDSIVVTGATGTIDVFWSENSDEIARRRARTHRSGIVEYASIATNIRDQGTAARFNESMMGRLAQMAVVLDIELFTTAGLETPVEHEDRRAGWDIGQMVSVFCSRPLVAGDFLITSCAFEEMGNRYLKYTLQARGRELPLILGVEVSANGSDWDVTVDFDRPHGLTPGDDLNLWGINNLGTEDPLNTSWIVKGTPTDTSVTWTTGTDGNPAVDLTGWTYNGGLGGAGTGFGGDDNLLGGIGGLIDDTRLPFGGNGWSGGPPTVPPGGITTTITNPGGGINGPVGTGDPALIIIDVNTSTREVTTHANHGFTTSYPDGGNRVTIVGVRGAADRTHTMNNPNTRITVTAPDKFIAEDVSPFESPVEPFSNDRRGRVYRFLEQTIRGGGNGGANSINILLGGIGGGTISEQNNATFVLANAIPGFASRPLQVAAAATNAWEQQKDYQVAESVSVVMGTPSEGGPVRIDIKRNGSSIFAAGYVEIPAGVTEVRTSDFVETPLVVQRGDKLQPDVTAVGSEFPGCSATVNVVLRG